MFQCLGPTARNDDFGFRVDVVWPKTIIPHWGIFSNDICLQNSVSLLTIDQWTTRIEQDTILTIIAQRSQSLFTKPGLGSLFLILCRTQLDGNMADLKGSGLGASEGQFRRKHFSLEKMIEQQEKCLHFYEELINYDHRVRSGGWEWSNAFMFLLC